MEEFVKVYEAACTDQSATSAAISAICKGEASKLGTTLLLNGNNPLLFNNRSCNVNIIIL